MSSSSGAVSASPGRGDPRSGCTDAHRLMEREILEHYARLAIEVGVNLQRGQELAIMAPPSAASLVHALAKAAYAANAKFVDAWYFDPALQRIRAESADAETLEYVPSWYGSRMLALGDARGARISIFPFAPPGNLDGIDGRRLGRDLLPRTREQLEVTHAKLTSWCVIPWPSAEWAAVAYPNATEPVRALVDDLIYVLRLDANNPVEAWRAHFAELDRVCRALNGHCLSAVRFEGPGTDLTVGLFPSSRFISVADWETVDGVRFANNLPSEEVLTTPDPARADGFVTATKALDVNGVVVQGMQIEFAAGRITKVNAERGVELLRELAGRDEGACRLGEVALVSGQGRVAATQRMFFNTLLDENAATHLALGNAYSVPVGDSDLSKINRSSIHLDFMIGSPNLEITGIRDSGDVPVMKQNEWQL
jgi:aminopeptidase